LAFLGLVKRTFSLVILRIASDEVDENSNHAWKSASVIAPIVIGFFVFASCFVYDFVVKPKNAFLPIELFRNTRGFTLLLVIVFVAGMIFYSMSALLVRVIYYRGKYPG